MLWSSASYTATGAVPETAISVALGCVMLRSECTSEAAAGGREAAVVLTARLSKSGLSRTLSTRTMALVSAKTLSYAMLALGLTSTAGPFSTNTACVLLSCEGAWPRDTTAALCKVTCTLSTLDGSASLTWTRTSRPNPVGRCSVLMYTIDCRSTAYTSSVSSPTRASVWLAASYETATFGRVAAESTQPCSTTEPWSTSSTVRVQVPAARLLSKVAKGWLGR